MTVSDVRITYGWDKIELLITIFKCSYISLRTDSSKTCRDIDIEWNFYPQQLVRGSLRPKRCHGNLKNWNLNQRKFLRRYDWAFANEKFLEYPLLSFHPLSTDEKKKKISVLLFLVRIEIQIPSLYPSTDWGISKPVLIGRALNECLSLLFLDITQHPPAYWKVNGNKFFVINLKQFRLCHNAIMRRCRIEQWNFYHNQYRERGKQWIIAAMSTDVDFVI